MAKGKGSGKFKGKSEAGPAPPSGAAPPGGMPPGGMPPGGMPPGGMPPGMMGGPPGRPGATEIELKIRPYKKEDHKEVVQLFRNAVTDDTLQVMMR